MGWESPFFKVFRKKRNHGPESLGFASEFCLSRRVGFGAGNFASCSGFGFWLLGFGFVGGG